MKNYYNFKDANIQKQIGSFMNKYNQSDEFWYLFDKTLYDLCKKYPLHNNEQEVMAKMCLIGRAYSAQVERRQNKNNTQGDFYKEYVVPAVIHSEIDDKIAELKKFSYPDKNNVETILLTHKYLQDILTETTDMSNRSFVSKYLHFHCPNLFYIYDSYSSETLNRIVGKNNRQLTFIKGEVDNIYKDYFCRSLYIQETLDTKRKDFPKILDTFLQDKYYNKKV